jgi:ATP-dependent DNA ligase
MMQLPQLKGEAVSGKEKVWSVRVLPLEEKAIIETTHGYKDGKMQVNEKIVEHGKNLGKKNATTAFEQAVLEAKSAWTKKKESGYSDATTSEEKEEKEPHHKEIDESVPTPMLAHDYHKRGKDIVFPCLVQPKLDGTRCVAVPGKGLFSRNRKAYPHLAHIKSEIDKLDPSIILDGELYSNTLSFQEIVGIVKKEKELSQKESQIKFHVYDVIINKPFVERLEFLTQLFKQNNFKTLVLVKTEPCKSEGAMKEIHEQYIMAGWEGIMLRNHKGMYKYTRSVDLQKFKLFFDTECEIIGCKEGEGLEKGCVVWQCKTDEGKTFSCRPRGSREERQEMFLNGESYVGKMLTVRYQEKTDDGLLRFPVGIAMRDYE